MRGKATLCNAFAKLVGGGSFPVSCSLRAGPASASGMVALLPQLSGSLMDGGAARSATSPKPCNEPSPPPSVSASSNPFGGFLVCGHRSGCVCLLAPKT